MKKIIGLLSFLTFVQMSFAQDLKKVTTSILLGKFENAKDEYDKAVAKKASLGTTAEGYYLKARINGVLAKDPALASKYPNAYADMRKALDEYIKLEPNFSTAKDNGPDPFFDIYFKAFKEGVDAFNAKKWKEAATSFDEAVKYSDIVFSQGWSSSKQKFDTTSLMYAGYSNQNAGNLDASNVYYRRMVDANIKSADALDIYRFLLMQFNNKKDLVNFEKYYDLSVAAYPTENWFEYKLDYIEKHFSMVEKMSMYDKMVADASLNENAAQMFGDMFMAGKTLEGLSNETAEVYLSLIHI
jgi:tetratricopeptide (TPR) repeat protein